MMFLLKKLAWKDGKWEIQVRIVVIHKKSEPIGFHFATSNSSVRLMLSTDWTGDEIFVHTWRLEVSDRIHRLQEHVITAHGLALYEWKLKLSTEEEYSFMRGTVSRIAGQPQLTVAPSVLFESSRTPQLTRLVFTAVAKKGNGEVIFGPSTSSLENLDMNTNDGIIHLPIDSAVGKIIANVSLGYSGASILDISISFHLPKQSFELGKWINAAPACPEKRDFRFRVIDDLSRHDIKLIGSDGILSSNRAALFQSSAYFRRRLSEQPNITEFHEDYSLSALTTVITYLFTEEMTLLNRRYRPAQIQGLHAAMERSACEQLTKEQDNLEQVVKWYLTAVDSDMYRLENVALSLILLKHLNDFAVELLVAEPSSPQMRDLHERLHRRRSIFRTEPLVCAMKEGQSQRFQQKIIRARMNMIKRFEKILC